MLGRASSPIASAAVAAVLISTPATAEPNVAPAAAFDPVFDVLPAPVRDAILGPDGFEVANLPDAVGGANVAPTPVAVSTVPEPLSWAMMIAGFGLLGIALRRRRTRHLA
jgi:hypothetical protein